MRVTLLWVWLSWECGLVFVASGSGVGVLSRPAGSIAPCCDGVLQAFSTQTLLVRSGLTASPSRQATVPSQVIIVESVTASPSRRATAWFCVSLIGDTAARNPADKADWRFAILFAAVYDLSSIHMVHHDQTSNTKERNDDGQAELIPTRPGPTPHADTAEARDHCRRRDRRLSCRPHSRRRPIQRRGRRCCAEWQHPALTPDIDSNAEAADVVAEWQYPALTPDIDSEDFSTALREAREEANRKSDQPIPAYREYPPGK